MPHPADDDLAMLALGEQMAGVASHVTGCARCAAELDALRSAVRTARAGDLTSPPPAPPAVWVRIADELDLAAPSRGRRLLVGAAAAVAALAVLAGVLFVGNPADRPSSTATQVALSPLGKAGGSGSVRLVAGAGGREMDITTRGLPRTSGFYEVWLLDPANGHLVALGSLDDAGSAQLPVPRGVAMADYPTVDVSQQPDNGNPAHSGHSVLRARLPT